MQDLGPQLPNSPVPEPARPYLPPSRPRIGWALAILFFLLMMLILPSLAEQISYSVARGRVNAEADAAQRQLEDPHAPNLSDYARVAKLLNPSVTGVKASHIVNGPADEMSFLFGGRSRMREQDQGSGVIVDEAGYVI